MTTNESTPVTPQAGEADPINPQAQAATVPPTEPQAGDSQKPPLNTADYERMIAELRKESAAHRTKLNKFEADEKARTDAQLTEQQKKDKQLADLQKAHDEAVRQHQEYKVSTEVRLQAAQMGFADLNDASRLLDWSEIEYGTDGAPTNVKTLLDKLLKAKPYLQGKAVVATPTAGGATSPARSQTTDNAEITQTYVADVMNGKIPWRDLSQERRTAVLNWQAKNPYKF